MSSVGEVLLIEIKVEGDTMQGVVRVLLVVGFSAVTAESGVYGAAAPMYPSNELIERAPTQILDFIDQEASFPQDYAFRNYELYRSLGVGDKDSMDIISVAARRLADLYAATADTDRFAFFRRRFILSALYMLTNFRREYDALFYIWEHRNEIDARGQLLVADPDVARTTAAAEADYWREEERRREEAQRQAAVRAAEEARRAAYEASVSPCTPWRVFAATMRAVQRRS